MELMIKGPMIKVKTILIKFRKIYKIVLLFSQVFVVSAMVTSH